jgi:tetratricopeptide (TPR) repeat protein
VAAEAASAAEALEEAPPPSAFEGGPGQEPPLAIDPELLERTAAELQPPTTDRVEDLVSEAEVLAKYGLQEKAEERLREALEINPQHLGAHALEISLLLEATEYDQVMTLANRMATLSDQPGYDFRWQEVRNRLLRTGFHLDGDQVVAVPGAEVEVEDVDLELEAVPDEAELGTAAEVMDEAAAEAAEVPAELMAEPAEPAAPTPAAGAGEAAADVVEEPAAEPAEAAAEAAAQPVESAAEGAAEAASDATPEAASAQPPPEEGVESAAEPEAEAAPKPRPGGVRTRVDAALAKLTSELLGGKRRRPAAEAAEPPAPTEPPAAAAEAAAEAAVPPPAEAPSAAEPAAEPPMAAQEPEPAAPSPPVAAAPPADEVDELDLFEITEAEEAEAVASGDGGEFGDSRIPLAPPPTAPPAAAAGEIQGAAAGAGDEAARDLDDSMSWLDEVPADEPAATFSGESDFFDLAAELEQELSAEEAQDSEGIFAPQRDQSLEEIVEGFKRGVAENLSEHDYATHFNLGIAYREMGLLDEAIGELQLASKEPSLLVECCSMLGICFLEKGLPELAIKWYRRGLESPHASEEESLGLLYELGDAQLIGGDRSGAYDTFVEIYGINTNYRDVVARLEELAP